MKDLKRIAATLGENCAKCFLLSIFLLMPLLVQAQEKQRISVDLRGETLEAALWYLQNRTKFVFMYATEDIEGVTDISVKAKDKTIPEILDECLEGTILTYEISGSAIIIKKKEVAKVTITGWVRDINGESLPGVTILIKGMKQGSVTGLDGRYTISIPDDKGLELIYSFIGMEKRTLKYTGKKEINVTLESSTQEIDEVVVTGYQNIQRRDLVGSLTTLKADDIKLSSATTIDKMLQGRVAGMVVTNSSARVGTSPKIQIRGTSTLMGNQDPLWVVDGIIQEDPLELNTSNLMTGDLADIIGNQVSWLNPADIDKITILKDASATAIYGSKASNGVIEITTKKSTSDRLTVNYSANFNIGSQANFGMFNFMNSKERVLFSQEAFNAGVLFAYEPISQPYTYEGLLRMYMEHEISADEFLAQRNNLETQNTDWFSLLTRRSFSHNHNVSISGGTNKYSYSASLGYTNAQGQEIGNNSERMTGRISLTLRPISRLNINLTINGSTSTNTGFAANVNPLSYATTTNRIIDPDVYYQKHETYRFNDNVKSLSYNIFNEREHSGSTSRSTLLSASLDVQLRILDWLSYQFTGGYTDNSSNNESYAGEQTLYIARNYRGYDYNSITPGSPEFKSAQLPFGGELYTNEASQNSYNIQNKIQISKAFNTDNRLNALIGMELRSSTNRGIGNTVWGYIPERGNQLVAPTTPEEFEPISNAFGGWGLLDNIYSGRWKKTEKTDNYFSLFATFAYSFMNRYVINANIRNDASNRFGQDTNHRIDPTYSLGFSWRASEEDFMREHVKWVHNLNFRGTYGIQGNAVTRISPDLILNQGKVANLYNRYESSISQIPNPYLSWERTQTWNIGMDLGLFNFFDMNLEYYSRRSNAIIELDIPYEYGLSTMQRNGGIIYNKGIEYTLSFTPIQKKDYALNVSLNASKNWNKGGESTVVDVKKDQYLSGASGIILKEGYPLTGFWSYSFAGLNGETGEAMFNYLDVPEEKRNKKIDPTTFLVYSGQTEPYFTGGLSLSFRYKQWTLSSSFSLLLGNKKRLPSPYEQFGSGTYMPEPYDNVNRDLLNRWKEPGDELHTIIPSLPTANKTVIFLPDEDSSYSIPLWEQSDAMVVSGSFLRCQNIGLSWQMSREWCDKIHAKSLSLSFNMDNLFVIASKRFNGFDPEVSNSVLPHTYSIGLNVGF